MKVLSVDAESNGLYGQPFCIGAVCTTDDGQPADVYLARCPIAGPVDPWVAANVLPALEGVLESWGGYPDPYTALLADFADWFDAHNDADDVIAHVAAPVEAGLFRDMTVILDRGPFTGPFPLHDVASALRTIGADPTSVDSYVADHGLDVGPGFERMRAHNPLYDARVAELVWRHILAGQQPSPLIDGDTGRRITEMADMHPKRALIWALAQAGHDLDMEGDGGAGMWWHLERALAVADGLPELRLDTP